MTTKVNDDQRCRASSSVERMSLARLRAGPVNLRTLALCEEEAAKKDREAPRRHGGVTAAPTAWAVTYGPAEACEAKVESRLWPESKAAVYKNTVD